MREPAPASAAKPVRTRRSSTAKEETAQVAVAGKAHEAAKKSAKVSAKHLDRLIAEAITDAYTDAEQAGGFLALMEEHLALPFATRVLDQEVKVIRLDSTAAGEIVAVCTRGKRRQKIPILDLPLPEPRPAGAEWIDAYRRWLRS